MLFFEMLFDLKPEQHFTENQTEN